MDTGLYDLVEGILRTVVFMAVGGCLALVFFFVFAQSILGSKTIHAQLKKLSKQIEETNELLKEITPNLKKQDKQNS